jgi:hypothetical protein
VLGLTATNFGDAGPPSQAYRTRTAIRQTITMWDVLDVALEAGPSQAS